MPKASDPALRTEAVRLYRSGETQTEIARKLKVHQSTISKWVRNHTTADERGKELEGGPPPEMGRAVDNLDVDGTVSVTRQGKVMNPDEMVELVGANTDIWIPERGVSNIWQGFYKKKPITTEQVQKMKALIEAGKSDEQIIHDMNAGEAHVVVPLTQSKVSFKRIMAENVQDAILSYVRQHVTPFKVDDLPKTRRADGKEVAVAWGLWDTHIGMYAWQSEVGADYDVDVAKRRVMNSIDDMARELQGYNIKTLWMPVGNDFMHFDNVRRTTTMGDHLLDTDTRYGRVYKAALECLIYMVQRALELCDNIQVMYIPGNHDTATSFTLNVALEQRYINDERVSVDLGPNPRKYRMHGGSLVMFDHGQIPANKYPLILVEEAHELVSRATYKEVQVGHTHQRAAKDFQGLIPTNGVTVRVNPTLCTSDFWHHSKGFIGEAMKSVEAWVYDDVGYRASHCCWARDDDRQ